MHVHGGGRFDLNDWGKDERDYVQAVFNIKLSPGASNRVADLQIPAIYLPKGQEPDAIFYVPIKQSPPPKNWK